MKLNEFVNIVCIYKESFEKEQKDFGDIPNDFGIDTWIRMIKEWHGSITKICPKCQIVNITYPLSFCHICQQEKKNDL